MVDQYSNIFLTVMFGAIAVWLFYGYAKCRKHPLIFKDKMWTWPRILFAAAGVLCIVAAFAYSTMLDWIRLAAMALCVAAFLLLRDGIAEDGFSVMGRFYPFSKVRAYDYGDYKKNFRVYFVLEGNDNENMNYVQLEKKDREEIIKFLKSTIGRKYTRMKKG